MLCEFKFLYCIEHSLKPGHLNFNSIKRLLIDVNWLLLNVKYSVFITVYDLFLFESSIQLHFITEGIYVEREGGSFFSWKCVKFGTLKTKRFCMNGSKS